MTTFISIIAGIFTMGILDFIWLTQIAKSWYLKALSYHVTITNGSLVPNVRYIPFVYAVAISAIFIFVLPKSHTIQNALLYGALFGFFMYAFYDITNLAVFKEYPLSIAIIDIVWGTFLVGVTSAVIYTVKNL